MSKRTTKSASTASRNAGSSVAGQDEDGGSEPAGRSGSNETATPYRITSSEALDNTRKLLAEKKARSRRTPAWQAHEDTHPPGHVPPPGFESGSARDRADDLHQGEMRLDANEGSISDQDRRNQGKRDSR